MPRRLRERRRIGPPLVFLAVATLGVGWLGNDFLMHYEDSTPSVSRGDRNNGSLKYGKRLRTNGPNFVTYSRFGSSFGRTCVHEKVRSTVLDAYKQVLEKDRGLRFVYGETGWCSGGSFWPHRTHQNGMSVDFMVPTKRNGRTEELPHTVLDLWGYGLEFDEDGRLGEYEIDFEAMALHLEALRKTAKNNGLRIDRVFLDPALQKKLFATKRGRKLRKQLKFNKKPAWTRHDDHYHVDFEATETKTDARGRREPSG